MALSNSREGNFTSLIIVFIIFFGMPYIPFYDFSSGASLAPSFLRYIKYFLLVSLLIYVVFSKCKLHPGLTAVALFTFYLTFSLILKKIPFSENMAGYVQLCLPILSLSGLFLLKKSYLGRFTVFYISSVIVSSFFSFYFFLNYNAAWLKDDLVSGQVSVSGLLDSSNRFGIFSIIGFWMITLLRLSKTNIFILQSIVSISLALTGSFGVVVLFIITNLVYLILVVSQKNFSEAFRNLCVASVFLLVAFWVFKDSAVLLDVRTISQKVIGSEHSPTALGSNSFTGRLSILKTLQEMFFKYELTEILFGMRKYSRPDSFIAFVIFNTGLLGFALLLWQSLACLKCLIRYKNSNKQIYNFIVNSFLVIFLSFLYEESSLHFPYWFFVNIVMSFTFNIADFDGNKPNAT